MEYTSSNQESKQLNQQQQQPKKNLFIGKVRNSNKSKAESNKIIHVNKKLQTKVTNGNQHTKPLDDLYHLNDSTQSIASKTVHPTNGFVKSNKNSLDKSNDHRLLSLENYSNDSFTEQNIKPNLRCSSDSLLLDSFYENLLKRNAAESAASLNEKNSINSENKIQFDVNKLTNIIDRIYEHKQNNRQQQIETQLNQHYSQPKQNSNSNRRKSNELINGFERCSTVTKKRIEPSLSNEYSSIDFINSNQINSKKSIDKENLTTTMGNENNHLKSNSNDDWPDEPNHNQNYDFKKYSNPNLNILNIFNYQKNNSDRNFTGKYGFFFCFYLIIYENFSIKIE